MEYQKALEEILNRMMGLQFPEMNRLAYFIAKKAIDTLGEDNAYVKEFKELQND